MKSSSRGFVEGAKTKVDQPPHAKTADRKLS